MGRAQAHDFFFGHMDDSRDWIGELTPEQHAMLDTKIYLASREIADQLAAHLSATGQTLDELADFLSVTTRELEVFFRKAHGQSRVRHRGYVLLEHLRKERGIPKTDARVKDEQYFAKQIHYWAAHRQGTDMLSEQVLDREMIVREQERKRCKKRQEQQQEQGQFQCEPPAVVRFPRPPQTSLAMIACVWRLNDEGREAFPDTVLEMMTQQYKTVTPATLKKNISELVKRRVLVYSVTGHLSIAPPSSCWWINIMPSGAIPARDLQLLAVELAEGNDPAVTMGVPKGLADLLLSKYQYGYALRIRVGSKAHLSAWELVDEPRHQKFLDEM
jgi:hypothetical protein